MDQLIDITQEQGKERRLAAHSRGDLTFVGIPCMHGHWVMMPDGRGSPRSVITGGCVGCKREASKKQDAIKAAETRGVRPGGGVYARKGGTERKPAKLPIRTPEGFRPITREQLMAGRASGGLVRL